MIEKNEEKENKNQDILNKDVLVFCFLISITRMGIYEK